MTSNKKRRFVKDEVASHEILKEMERQVISVSDHEKFEEMEWRYCRTCKKVVEPTLSKKLLELQLAKRRSKRRRAQSFMVQAGGQVCPFCDERLIPKEIRRNRYCCIFTFCLWVIIIIVLGLFSPNDAGAIGGILLWVILIGFIIYNKLAVEPRLKKKMQFGESKM